MTHHASIAPRPDSHAVLPATRGGAKQGPLFGVNCAARQGVADLCRAAVPRLERDLTSPILPLST
ncbi:hypothetical protein BCAR13_240030 [Paraburkholderia caribensis]|nr:hypothetical protein BCAR13_240030 [Paraburkholderia caribensis]